MLRTKGAIYVRSPQPLLSYAVKLTERLEHWADKAPGRTFLAQRDEASEWRLLTYSETLRRVRAIAQSLINRQLDARKPVLVLAGNSIEHALLALACMYAGVPYAPVSPTYLRALPELKTLRHLWKQVEPALVFAYDGEEMEASLGRVLNVHTELITVKPPGSLRATPFEELATALRRSFVDERHAQVTGDTVAKIMFTSGSTSTPKGVITTQRMLCSNQQMIRSMIPFLADEPPVLCDWLPWNHVFGGSHNFGIALYNGGTLYIDEGRPTPSGFATTLANLRSVVATAYLSVPKSLQMLVPVLRADEAFNRHFFSRLKVALCAGASLNPSIWNEIQRLSVDTGGEEILLMNALGSTESAPMALATVNSAGAMAGGVGLPVPGVELKVVPENDKWEARLRGPNITPGFWRDPERTAAAFDEEGFYRTGDAIQFVDANRTASGFRFDGRLDGNFKLSTGTWVRVGALCAKLMEHLAGLADEIVLAAPDRDYVTAILFSPPGVTPEQVGKVLKDFAARNQEITTPVLRALVLDERPSAKAGEITDKGTLDQLAVRRHRAALIEELYCGSTRVIELKQAGAATIRD